MFVKLFFISFFVYYMLSIFNTVAFLCHINKAWLFYSWIMPFWKCRYLVNSCTRNMEGLARSLWNLSLICCLHLRKRNFQELPLQQGQPCYGHRIMLIKTGKSGALKCHYDYFQVLIFSQCLNHHVSLKVFHNFRF